MEKLIFLRNIMGIGRIEKHQRQMIFISHDLAVVRYLCDLIAVMYKERIVEGDLTERLFSQPRHNYTGKLLSTISMWDFR